VSININVISGFLGVGKTTLIKKIIPAMKGRIVLIENEFGDVGIDGNLIPGEFPIKEINSGCICCSVAKDFQSAIEELAEIFNPDEILIEPSGVASLSDIVRICRRVSAQDQLEISIKRQITIVDVSAFNDDLENFGAFYLDQIQNAHIILLSYYDYLNSEDGEKVIAQIRSLNQTAFILKEDWFSYDGEKLMEILEAIEGCEIESKENTVLLPAHKMFRTFSIDCPRIFTQGELDQLLASLQDQEYGFIFRAKGILELDTNQCIHFDFTPYHTSWTYLDGSQFGKVVVIGSDLNLDKISALF